MIYVGEYRMEEEQLLIAGGIRSVRVERGHSFDRLRSVPNGSQWFVRSERMSQEEYAELWAAALAEGIHLVTSPESFRIANNFELYYPAIQAFSPKGLSAPSQTTAADLLTLAQKAGLHAPLFVRSDIESAAKFAGVEACTVHELSIQSLAPVLETLHQYVRSFKETIIKEVFPISTTEGGMRLEYRAIGVAGKLIAFDQKEASQLPSPGEAIRSVTSQALASLAAHGATGAIFVDTAVAEGGSCFVVECKDLVTGTIANPGLLARELRAFSIPS